MIPFHKIYSAIFKSFDINSETETVERLEKEGVQKIMIIKRSWIFALAMIWIPILILFISGVNIFLALNYYRDDILKYSLMIGVMFSVLLFIFSVWNYLRHFREIYDAPKVTSDIGALLSELREGDSYFTRFFNQTISNQWIIITLIIWSGLFYLSHMKTSWNMMILIDAGLLFIQWVLLGKYRKRMMDLEMDYNIVIPGKIIFVNQSGMLSSSQAVEGEKVKTVTAKYPGWLASFFQYGTIEIMTEGGETMLGTTSMYFVPYPTETARLIQTLLEKERNDTPLPEISQENSREQKNTPQIGPKEVTYDVKGVVRDVLR